MCFIIELPTVFRYEIMKTRLESEHEACERGRERGRQGGSKHVNVGAKLRGRYHEQCVGNSIR